MIYGFNRKGREILMARFCFGNHSIELGVRTRIMGILNVTPDSFSDGGKYDRPSDAVGRALEMEREGADIIDIGAQSTRPGHVPITAEQEWERLEPVLAALKGRLGAPISVDTFYPEVAAAAVAAGASIINDVSGGIDNGMIEVAIKTGAGIVMMHGGGGADDAGNSDPFNTVRAYFERAIRHAEKAGLPLERVCLDPGIGFGKDRQGDIALIARLPALVQGLPRTAVLVGASRKRVIASCCETEIPPDKRLAGTLAIHSIAAWNGADILRVHDVAQGVQAARVIDALRKHKV